MRMGYDHPDEFRLTVVRSIAWSLAWGASVALAVCLLVQATYQSTVALGFLAALVTLLIVLPAWSAARTIRRRLRC